MISKYQVGLLNSISDSLIFNFVLKLGSVCPLVFPNMTNIVKECGNVINNQTACCKAMETYVSQLQQQSFLTNLQVLNCAASLGMRLQEANVSYNVYNLCQLYSIPLK
jgi:alanine-alpha-ketoisovalerate/valine-pyruvate aminotransferase